MKLSLPLLVRQRPQRLSYRPLSFGITDRSEFGNALPQARGVQRGATLWLRRVFLVRVQRKRKENTLMSYGISY